MPDDILDAAQKVIDNAAGLPPEPAPPTPTPPSSQPPSEEATKLVESLLEPKNPAPAPEPPKPPLPPSKKKVSGVVIALILLVFGGLVAAGSYFVSQRNQIADTRSQARETDCRDGGAEACSGKYKCLKVDGSWGCFIPTPKPPGGGGGDDTGDDDTGDDDGNLCPYDCVPKSQCKAGGKSKGLGYGDCGAGEWCCQAGGGNAAPTPTPGGYKDNCQDNSNCANGYECKVGKCEPISDQSCKGSDPGAPTCCDKKRECPKENWVCEEGRRVECKTGEGPNAVWCTIKIDAEYCGGGGGDDDDDNVTPPKCQNIKIYKGNQEVTPSTLKPGDDVKLAVKGNRVGQKGRFRVNGAAWTETTTKNGKNEWTLNYTIPSGVTDFVIEGEVFIGGAWR